MVELDGRSYVVNTPTENAFALLEYVNQFMVDNDVRNKKGEIVQFKISLASPIWLLIIGIGYLATVCQKIMYSVAQAFNIADCSDQQLLDLARIARLSRKEGSYTTVSCIATASDAGTCHITTDLEAKVTYEGNDYTFHPIYAVDIPAGTSAEVILICSVTGPVYFEIGAIANFTDNPQYFSSMTSQAPQPGSDIESITQLRTRLMVNNSISPLEGAIQGLNALDGITKATVLFNTNYDSEMVLGGKTVPPKRAVVFIQGYSDKIAQEYLKHMSAETYNDGTARSQTYALENGQSFMINYYTPIALNLKVQVNVNKPLTLERTEEIKLAIARLSNSRQIGEDYTSAYIIDSLNTNVSFTEITGVQLSTDDGETWSSTTHFNEGNTGLIAFNDVAIILPEGA